jgi:hypothetical protein
MTAQFLTAIAALDDEETRCVDLRHTNMKADEVLIFAVALRQTHL